MPTSTFPLWWSHETIIELLNAAREGASYQDMDAIAKEGSGRPGSVRTGGLRSWVRMWKDRPSDRPQARLAAAIASYDPPSTRESLAMRVVERALALHHATCDCGKLKDDPADECCVACVMA